MSLKELLQEAVRIAKADLACAHEMEWVRNCGSSFSLGPNTIGWHGPHSGGMPSIAGIDWCVLNLMVLVIAYKRCRYGTALDG